MMMRSAVGPPGTLQLPYIIYLGLLGVSTRARIISYSGVIIGRNGTHGTKRERRRGYLSTL